MAYTKTLIGDITEKGFHDPATVKLQSVAAVCDTNFTDIQSTLTDIAVEATADLVGGMVTGNTETGISVTYQDSDNTLDFAVAYGTTAATACQGNDSRLADARTPVDHAHAGVAGDGGTLAGYQADLTASSTLADLGVAAIDPALSGALTGITNASTLAELLTAIDTHTHT
jgi:hypothetical protein